MNMYLLQDGGAGGSGFMIMMVLVFGVMYFFMIRPQRKREKEVAKMREGLKKDDKIVTAGGIHGVIASVEEETVTIFVESHAKIRIEKASISIINGVGGANTAKR